MSATTTIKATHRDDMGEWVFPQLGGLICPVCGLSWPAEVNTHPFENELHSGNHSRCKEWFGGCGAGLTLVCTPDGWGLIQREANS